MSTQLLEKPGKVHELCDDLESLWFVFLYEALHFVKHDQPSGISMDLVFDQVERCPKTGTHTGGAGKTQLYNSQATTVASIAFASGPLTALVQKMYKLFRRLSVHCGKQDFEMSMEGGTEVKGFPDLEDCKKVQELFQEALDSPGWSAHDKVEDQYPPNKHLTPRELTILALSFRNSAFEQWPDSGEPSGTKRKRDENEDEDEGEGEGNPPDSPLPPKANRRKRASRRKVRR